MNLAENMIKTLRKLTFKIRKEIEEGISKGVLHPEESVYFRRKVNEFEYGERGVTKYSAKEEYITKKSWFGASFKVIDNIKKSNEYSSTLESLVEIFRKEDKTLRALEHFIQKLILNLLSNSDFNEKYIDQYIATFLKDLKEEPLRCGAEVDLDGIVILSPRIEFKVGDMNIILKQTTNKDLEKEFPIYGFMGLPHLQKPSAILKVDFPGRQANEIQMKVEQSVTLLRLFKVGSVKYISYRMYSESLMDIMASEVLPAGEHYSAFEKYVITEKDMEKLKKFWQIMIKAIPQNFYELGETRLDHIAIAYKRYCDALLLNGILERRNANAIMGLESLFLKGGETQELRYRLGVRVTKIFSYLGYDPQKVRKIIGDAYKIRSLFVHGGHLSYKDKRK
ncbi:MAG: hypothetical protein ACE5K0_04630, partial [Candidatus Methanofastidiosia archaeon]